MLYVYTGPSLDHDSVLKLLPNNTTVCPPIKGGDILNLLSQERLQKPTHIHIIDGYYYNVPSVRHKEILQALEQGVIVSGCSSMGAIRAAECIDFGMKGSGRIYNYFASQLVTGDDEIAVSHRSGPSFEKISTPLINVRFTIEDICNEGLLEQEVGIKIIDYYKELHFSERYLRSLESHPEFKQYYRLIDERYQDWKKIDAIESLELLASMEKAVPPSKTQFFAGYNPVNFYNDTIISGHSTETTERNQLPLELSKGNDYQKILYDSFNRSLAIRFAKHLGLINTQAEVIAFKAYVNHLRINGVKYNGLPVNYQNYYNEIIDQELLILKLHLWLADSSGLNGNLGVLSDYYSCFNIDLDGDYPRLKPDEKCTFYDNLKTLLSSLSEMPQEILQKYLGLSREQFCNDMQYEEKVRAN